MEKNKIFNKSVMDRLSSPEELDKQIVITPLSQWVFVVAGVLVVIIALIWSLTGWLLVTKDAVGIIEPQSDAYTQVSTQAGMVENVYVRKGDEVQIGDKLFSYKVDEYEDAINDLEERRDIVENITMSSSNDTVNQDTSELVKIKIQKQTGNTEKISANVSISAYQKELKRIEKDISASEVKVEKAKSNYEIACVEYSQGKISQTELNEAQEAYNKAQSEYAALQTEKQTVQQQIKTYKVQKEIANAGKSESDKSLSQQFSATKEAILNSIDSEIEQMKENKGACIVTSTVTGTVVELNVSSGIAIAQGNDAVTIRESKSGDNVVQLFIGANDSKSVVEGMEVNLYMSNLDRQEYGHMRGIVTYVDKYYSNSADMKKVFGNTSLASSIAQNGPVVLITCDIEKDSGTASGYYWSSKKGRSVVVDDQAAIEAEIVVEKNHPIETILPYIKTKAYELVGPKPEKDY